VIWLVDSLAGGSAASGTITTTGLYTPPAGAQRQHGGRAERAKRC
jgi:hypothetical protein